MVVINDNEEASYENLSAALAFVQSLRYLDGLCSEVAQEHLILSFMRYWNVVGRYCDISEIIHRQFYSTVDATWVPSLARLNVLIMLKAPAKASHALLVLGQTRPFATSRKYIAQTRVS